MSLSCRIEDLKCKEVINISDGARLGYICDAELDLDSGEITALVVPGIPRFFGLFGRGEDYVIPWGSIMKIGDDIILVKFDSTEYFRTRDGRVYNSK